MIRRLDPEALLEVMTLAVEDHEIATAIGPLLRERARAATDPGLGRPLELLDELAAMHRAWPTPTFDALVSIEAEANALLEAGNPIALPIYEALKGVVQGIPFADRREHLSDDELGWVVRASARHLGCLASFIVPLTDDGPPLTALVEGIEVVLGDALFRELPTPMPLAAIEEHAAKPIDMMELAEAWLAYLSGSVDLMAAVGPDLLEAWREEARRVLSRPRA